MNPVNDINQAIDFIKNICHDKIKDAKSISNVQNRVSSLQDIINNINRSKKLLKDENNIKLANECLLEADTACQKGKMILMKPEEGMTQPLPSPIVIHEDYKGAKKLPKVELKKEVASIEPIGDFKNQRTEFLKNLKQTLETFKTKFDQEKPLPVGLFREGGLKKLNAAFETELRRGNVKNIETMLAKQDDLIQLADFTKVCARHINENPQLFFSEEAQKELHDSLQPLVEILVATVQRFEETKMGWPNIKISSMTSIIPLLENTGLDKVIGERLNIKI